MKSTFTQFMLTGLMFTCVLFMIFCLNQLLQLPDHLAPIADFATIERVHYHNVPLPQLVESENKRKTKANQNKTKIRGRTQNKIPSRFDFSLKPSSYICFLLFMLGILTYVSLLCLLERHCGLGSTGVNTSKLKLNSFSQSSFIMLFSGVLTDAHHFPYLFSLFFPLLQ